MSVPINPIGSAQAHEHQRKLNAWQHTSAVPGYNDNVRKDAYGEVMLWDEYGKTTQYGWEIDHELPKSQFPGIATHPGNLRALHWKNNRSKGDKIGVDTLRNILGGR